MCLMFQLRSFGHYLDLSLDNDVCKMVTFGITSTSTITITKIETEV